MKHFFTISIFGWAVLILTHGKTAAIEESLGEVSKNLEFRCPNASLIAPCTCKSPREKPFHFNVICEGSQVTQTSVANLFAALREVNQELVTSDKRLRFNYLGIHNTSLGTLNLTPIADANISVDSFVIRGNPNLQSIAGPGLLETQYREDSGPAIEASTVFIHHNLLLVDSEVRDILPLFISKRHWSSIMYCGPTVGYQYQIKNRRKGDTTEDDHGVSFLLLNEWCVEEDEEDSVKEILC